MRKTNQAKAISLYIFAFMACAAPLHAETPYGIIIDAQSLSYSESFALDGFLNGLGGAGFSNGGDEAFTHNQIKLGVSYAMPTAGPLSNLTLSGGVTSRYDYAAQYTPGLAHYIYTDANKLTPPDGNYDLSLSLNEISAAGIWGGVNYEITPDLALFANASYLTSGQATYGSAGGSGAIAAGDIDTLNVTLDYQFTDDLIFDTAYDTPDATGATFDIGATWKATSALYFDFYIADIWSEFHRSDMPRTIANATTETVTTNDDGTLNVRAALNGTNSRRDFTQSYASRRTARVRYALNDTWTLSQDVFNISDIWLSRSKVRYAISDSIAIGGEVEWKSGAVGVAGNWRSLELSVTTDDLDFKKARYLDVRLGLAHRF